VGSQKARIVINFLLEENQWRRQNLSVRSLM